MSPGDIGEALSGAPGAPGRFQRVGKNPDYLAIVDYAHAPGALAAAITAARELMPRRLIVLFGCGGDRDRGKRPMMGRAASMADLAILTSDNPRTEDPLAIIREAEPGLRDGGMTPLDRDALGDPKKLSKGYFTEPDRRAAIGLAALLLERGDMALVCGKGHEDYQIIGREKRPFHDAEETLGALEALGKG